MKKVSFLKKYGFYFLLLGVISDFLTPYVLGLFYPELNQMTAVMSLFGEVGSPVRGAFLIWSVVAGCFYTLSLPAIYTTFKETSKPMAGIVAAAIGYAGFLLFPLFLSLIYRKQKNLQTSRRYFVLLLLSLTIAAIYGLARIPQLSQFTLFQQLGFWQRLSFVFNYLPMILFSRSQLEMRT